MNSSVKQEKFTLTITAENIVSIAEHLNINN